MAIGLTRALKYSIMIAKTISVFSIILLVNVPPLITYVHLIHNDHFTLMAIWSLKYP
jgi:hypothetical protein